MKQGSTDDPFADDPEDEDSDQSSSDTEPVVNTSDSLDSPDSPPSPDELTSTSQRQSLPYIHSRDGVKDGRIQRPIFLREHIEEGIDDLVDQMEDEFGEDVYKTDVTEAAMAVAQEHPDLVSQTLDEWGYGWD
ncbi:hypothetical protein [Halococcoides cellulosivorans]|uniref:Uncharacterized protein n=1 Tax=Halococcoides cellulosivorans TaxID=1679096 RepID=A0A2R4X3M4_9EURY|nr:hypothetical protein [Halococcoides cellulosivorans]AWB28396.1 hypothetical protein HARCEL1_12130 [Halococcoides cellulosivorans]